MWRRTWTYLEAISGSYVGRLRIIAVVQNPNSTNVISNHVGVTTIERLDQGHLYPLGERRDKHVTGGARTSAPLHRRRTLYLKSYLDS
jgi:hypothetical protein